MPRVWFLRGKPIQRLPFFMNQTPPRLSLRNLPGDFLELLGSMRFAVSLLMFICIASLMGTVLAQNRSSNAYIDQFGPFWFEVLDKFSLWHVYNSWWFLLIMAFLVVSTSVCLIRNTPKMLRDARSFRTHIRQSSLRAFPHRVETAAPIPVAAAKTGLQALLGRLGYAVRERVEGDGVLLAAKKGSANRLGYIFAHSAMVIICVGGLLDSELPVRLQVMFGGKQPLVENMLISEVPESGRLSVNNPSFRASVLIPENGQASSAVVMVGDGALVQPMPFTLKLKQFIVDYYSTGMPSRFASLVDVTDPDTGKTFEAEIQVNEPLRFKGMTVYQSSFDDGGSEVTLRGHPLTGSGSATFDVDSVVGKTTTLSAQTAVGVKEMQLEIVALRLINVEDVSAGMPKSQGLSFGDHVASVAGSAAGKKNDHLRNVGPTIEYKLIDDAGQAYEFHNYMLPIELEGGSVFLMGIRRNAGEAYRYIRIPADDKSSIAEFMQLRETVADPLARKEAARRFTERRMAELRQAENAGQDRIDPQQLQSATEHALNAFASGGLPAVANFLQANTPQDSLESAAKAVLYLVGSGLLELRDIARERAGLAPLSDDEANAAAWAPMAVATALSDLNVAYPAPVLLTLNTFKQVQASVFQVSRTPGKTAVYLGSLLLILGVFTMFYVRDRRIWIWVRPDAQGSGSTIQAAMTSQKRTLDFNQEFDRFKQALLQQKWS